MFLVEHLIYQTMLDVDPSGVGACQIADKFFVRRVRLIRVCTQKLDQLLCFGFQSRRCQILGIFLGLPDEDNLPTYQSGSLQHSSTGVAKPSRIDSLMPGIDSKYSVS